MQQHNHKKNSSWEAKFMASFNYSQDIWDKYAPASVEVLSRYTVSEDGALNPIYITIKETDVGYKTLQLLDDMMESKAIYFSNASHNPKLSYLERYKAELELEKIKWQSEEQPFLVKTQKAASKSYTPEK